MARNINPVCRLCRRQGEKLYLKGERCHSVKCPIDKQTNNRNFPPGMHHWRRGKISEYGRRLKEKQKAKRYYGLLERQFKNCFHRAEKQKGNTGTNLLVLLERRLDNVLSRGGMALSRPHARQMINHGHISVNGKKVDIPSYLVWEGDVIQAMPHESSKKIVQKVRETGASNPPSWLEVLSGDTQGIKVINMPVREEIPLEIHEQLIVEFFSR